MPYQKLEKFQESRKQLDNLCCQLFQIIQDCNAHHVLPNTLADEVIKISNKLQSQRFRIAIVGEFSRGKSTLINALVGEKIQPVRAIACNATVTVLKYGLQQRIVCHYKNGRQEEISREQYQEKVTLSKEAVRKHLSDELAHCDIEEIVFAHPNLKLCQNGVEILDSPGLNEHPDRAAVTQKLLKNIDAVIFITSASQALSQGEREIIQDSIAVINSGKENEPVRNLFILVNKMDELDCEEDWQDVKETVEEFAYGENSVIAGDNRIHFISAKNALNSIINNTSDGYLKSFYSFTDSVEKFLTYERGSLDIKQSTTNLNQLIQITLDDLEQTEKILEENTKDSEAENNKIIEHIGNASGRDIKIRNLAQRLQEDAIKEANKECSKWRDGLWKAIKDKSKNWSSKHSPVWSQKQLIDDYAEQFVKDLSTEIKNWGNKEIEGEVLKPKLKKLKEEIRQEISAILTELEHDSQFIHYRKRTRFIINYLEKLSSDTQLSINEINGDFVGAGGFVGGIGIGGALVAGLLFFARIGMFAGIIAGLVTTIISSIALGMLDVDKLRFKIKQKVYKIGLEEFEKSKDKFSQELSKVISQVFDERVESASRVIAKAISLSEVLLEQQEKAHQEIMIKNEAKKAFISQKRYELEQVQDEIDAILNQFVE